MNNRAIETAHDLDLRLSYQALLRAAKRAPEVALQTGTLIVISRNGVVEQLDPATEAAPLSVQADLPSYQAKRGRRSLSKSANRQPAIGRLRNRQLDGTATPLAVFTFVPLPAVLRGERSEGPG